MVLRKKTVDSTGYGDGLRQFIEMRPRPFQIDPAQDGLIAGQDREGLGENHRPCRPLAEALAGGCEPSDREGPANRNERYVRAGVHEVNDDAARQ
jgi:hypothetical protein